MPKETALLHRPVVINLTEQKIVNAAGQSETVPGPFNIRGEAIKKHKDLYTELLSKPLAPIHDDSHPDYAKSINQLTTDKGISPIYSQRLAGTAQTIALTELRDNFKDFFIDMQRDINNDFSSKTNHSPEGKIAHIDARRPYYENELREKHADEIQKLNQWFTTASTQLLLSKFYGENIDYAKLQQTWKKKLEDKQIAERKALRQIFEDAKAIQLNYDRMHEHHRLTEHLMKPQSTKYGYRYDLTNPGETSITSDANDDDTDKVFALHNGYLANPYGSGAPMRVNGKTITMRNCTQERANHQIDAIKHMQLEAQLAKEPKDRIPFEDFKIRLTATTFNPEVLAKDQFLHDAAYQNDDIRFTAPALQKQWRAAILAGYKQENIITKYSPTDNDITWMERTQREKLYEPIRNETLRDLLIHSPGIPVRTPAQVALIDQIDLTEVEDLNDLKAKLHEATKTDARVPDNEKEWAKHLYISPEGISKMRCAITNSVMNNALKDAMIDGKRLDAFQQDAIDQAINDIFQDKNKNIKTVDDLIRELNSTHIPGLPNNWINKLTYSKQPIPSFDELIAKGLAAGANANAIVHNIFKKYHIRIDGKELTKEQLNTVMSNNTFGTPPTPGTPPTVGSIKSILNSLSGFSDDWTNTVSVSDNKKTFKNFLPRNPFTNPIAAIKEAIGIGAEKRYQKFTIPGLNKQMAKMDERLEDVKQNILSIKNDIVTNDANPTNTAELLAACQELKDIVKNQTTAYEILDAKMMEAYPNRAANDPHLKAIFDNHARKREGYRQNLQDVMNDLDTEIATHLSANTDEKVQKAVDEFVKASNIQVNFKSTAATPTAFPKAMPRA